MTRSSPQSNNISNQKRLPLPDALKRGAIALHNYELKQNGKGKRESPFKAKTGVSYGMTTKGKKRERIYIYVTYARTDEGKKLVVKEMAIATKGKIPIHMGRIKGAFWLIMSMSKRAYKRLVSKWSVAFRRSFALLVCLFLLFYAVLHPELKDIIMKIIETPIIPSF